METPPRLSNALWSGAFAAPLAVARWLDPSPEGIGTHRQLGLPPCTFLWISGFPCPFCGMTTSWSHGAHLQPLVALRTQPMGFVLFLVALGMTCALLVRAIAGARAFRPDRILSAIPPIGWWSVLAATLASWIYKACLVRGWI